MHYSATYQHQNVQPDTIRKWHLARGWSDIGYHYVITQDGRRHLGRRPETTPGAHVGGQNTNKIGICITGGLDPSTGANVGVDTRNAAQIAEQIALTRELLSRHPSAIVCGHLDLAATQCPAYDAGAWWRSVNGAKVSFALYGSTASTVGYPMTRLGSRGEAVRLLQAKLVERGIFHGSVDGVFNSATATAVRTFQGDAGIDIDGIVGPMTWAALLG
jgi:N-acetyl-anhydromuramyl-L-alanine amidase AmpD